MLNHTYTSVKNANLVDCGKKTHIASQPSALLRDNFLGEYRTELDKKKVLANLGIATDLSLEWEYIKGDIGRSEALMSELDSRTKYISEIDGFLKSLIEGVKFLETIIGSELDLEEVQDNRLLALEESTKLLYASLEELKRYLKETIEIDIAKISDDLESITKKVDNITELIKVSSKPGNALSLIVAELATHIWDATLNDGEGGYREVFEGETATHVFDGNIYREPILDSETGLYVPDLSEAVSIVEGSVKDLKTDVLTISGKLLNFVTKDELGGGDFNFIHQQTFNEHLLQTSNKFSEVDIAINDINSELKNTVKTGEDGHVNTLYVNTVSKETEGNIKITDSFEVESGIPLDIRFVVENLEELISLPVQTCYSGMGVIVNSLSSLYILRKPAEGVVLTQEYVSDVYNWKCPEDLVTVALTREAYDSLEEINPNVFYYIYEETITRTSEPNRKEYATEEEFLIEWLKWVDSLKTLSQEYMSASWGVDIENKLGKKASSESVNMLSEKIDNLKGGGDGITLESLSTDINDLQQSDLEFKELLDEILTKENETESGRLVVVEDKIKAIETDYVTKDYILDASNEFIFVKNDTYKSDQETLKLELSEEINSKLIITNTITLDSKVLNVVEDRLQFDSSPVAKVDDIPVINIMSLDEYDSLEEFDEKAYYYTYDDDVRVITKSELTTEIGRLEYEIDLLKTKIESLLALHPEIKL